MAPPTMRALVAAVAAAGAASLAHAQEAPGPGPASSAVTCGACTFMVDAAGVLTVEPVDEAQCVCTELDLSELGIVTLTEGVFDGLTVIEVRGQRAPHARAYLQASRSAPKCGLQCRVSTQLTDSVRPRPV